MFIPVLTRSETTKQSSSAWNKDLIRGGAYLHGTRKIRNRAEKIFELPRQIGVKNLLFCLLVWFALAGPVFSQNPAPVQSVALQEVKIHLAPRVASLKLRNPAKAFRLQKITPALVQKIRENVLQQLRAKGFYLAAIDSTREEETGQGRGVLHFFISPGVQFLLGKVALHVPDSLQERFLPGLKEASEPYLKKPYSADSQKRLLNSLLSVFENRGYPLCKIRTGGFTIDSLNERQKLVHLKLEVIPGPLVRLQGIRLPLKLRNTADYLSRTLRFRRGELYREKRIDRYRQILKRQDFVKEADLPQVIMGRDSSYYLYLNFKEAPVTSFDGIVGYVPPPANVLDQKGYFTGLVNLGLLNVVGTGRRLDIHWQKPDRFSEEFRVKYREPFVLGLPFHSGLEMHRMVRDTTYIEWEYALNFELPLSESLTGLFRFYNRQVFPDSLASAVLRLPHTKAVHSEMGINWDSRDDRFNPQKGVLFSLKFDYGTQRNVGPEYLLKEDSLVSKIKVTRLTGQLQFLLQFWKRQVLSMDFHTVFIGFQNQPVRLPDMFWFGGATTIRGYREQQFFAQRVGWVNTEYRFFLGLRSNFFVFTDAGYFSREVPARTEQFVLGYGVGIRFPVPLGMLQVDYGLAKGLTFREGKIHFRVVNTF